MKVDFVELYKNNKKETIEALIKELPFELFLNDKWNSLVFSLVGKNKSQFAELDGKRKINCIVTKQGLKDPTFLERFFESETKLLQK